MDSTARRRILAVTLGLFISLLFFPQSQRRVLAQSADDAAVRALVERYFAAYPAENLEAVIALWGEKSPDLAAAKERLKSVFAAHDRIEIRGLEVLRFAIEGESARAIATFEMSAIDAKTGKPAASVGKMNRAMGFAKEGGQWKVWSEEPAETQLAARLAAAKTDEVRQRLLNDEPELFTPGLRRALMEEAEKARVSSNYPQALALIQMALRVAEQISDKEGVANAHRAMGRIHVRRADYAEALEHYQKALEILEASGNKPAVAQILLSLGIVHDSQGNYGQALEYYQKSLALSESLQDATGIADALNNIGLVYYLQGEFARSIEYYEKSLTLKETGGDKLRVARALNNLGIVYRTQGNNARAVEYYQKSLTLKEAAGDKLGISVTLSSIGSLHFAQGNYAYALECFQKSMMLKEAVGDKAGLINSLNNIGDVHYVEGNFTRALEYFEKSLALSEAIGSKAGIARALKNVGTVHQSRGNYTRAMEYIQKSLALTEALGDKQGIASALAAMGDLHREQGRHAQALEFASRAVALFREIGNLDSLWRSQLTVGRAHASLGQPVLARQTLIDSINTIETLRSQVAGAEQDSQRFFEDKISPYQAMAELLIRENKPAEALTHAERAKARVLLDVLQNGRISVSKAMSAREQEEEHRLRGEMNSLNMRLRREGQSEKADQPRIEDLTSKLHQARRFYEEFQNRLYNAHPALRVQRGGAPPFSQEQAGELLTDSQTALLEYVVTEDAAFLFVLTHDENATIRTVPQKSVVKVFDLKVKRKDLAGRVEALRQRIANNDLEFAARSADLYDLLIKPAEAQLQGKTRLIIVPDDVLWETPFQALHPTGGRYLVQTAAISYAPSLTVLREMIRSRRKRATGGTLLAMGNPQLAGQTVTRSSSVLMNASFEPLPEAERLVKSLGRIYGSDASRVFVGAEAREDAFKAEAGKHRILQLATHGVLNDASPMYSHVVLSQSDSASEDGLLEAWEMMNLDLNAELVVLSACETARGKIGAGEGVIGITWALFVAGSPTTVVSQWKVESSSTTELMLEFHRNLRSRASKSEAMRRAAMKLIADRRYAHPFYWAGFIVVGDGN